MNKVTRKWPLILLFVLEVTPLAFSVLCVLKTSFVNIREKETSRDIFSLTHQKNAEGINNVASPSFPQSGNESRYTMSN